MLDRRFITGDWIMLAPAYLKKGCIVPKHLHITTNRSRTFLWAN
jgi:hypothetical protein